MFYNGYHQDILELLDMYTIGMSGLDESERVEAKKHFELSIFNSKDADKFIKNNNLKEVTNPIFFSGSGNIPTSDGLLSNEIFGISKEDRSGIFAYIDLSTTFIDPSCYKVWKYLNKNVKSCIHGTGSFSIDSDGNLIEDPDGKNGVLFLKQNIDKIKFKDRNDSIKRNIRIDYLELNRHNMFITKYFVIPPFYRDVNTLNNRVGIGEINRLYAALLTQVRALNETQDYGLPMDGACRGRIQELLLTIYDWFCGNNNNGIRESGTGMSGKFGIVKRSVNSKTTDYAARLVLSAPELKVETVDDLEADLDHIVIPLAAVCANFYPFIIFHVRRFFENLYMGKRKTQAFNKKTNETILVDLEDAMIVFSEERIKRELDRFIHGYSQRFIPIRPPVDEKKYKGENLYIAFIGRVNDPQLNPEHLDNVDPSIRRPMTWCDVFFQAATKAVDGKAALFTRYPIDSIYNQFPARIRISSTLETEPLYIESTYYPRYPKIRDTDLGTDTGNKFVDTLQLTNLNLDAAGADYDGDQGTERGSYTEESNAELLDFIDNSKASLIGLGGKNLRVCGKECLQSLYNLTLALPDTKLIDPEF